MFSASLNIGRNVSPRAESQSKKRIQALRATVEKPPIHGSIFDIYVPPPEVLTKASLTLLYRSLLKSRVFRTKTTTRSSFLKHDSQIRQLGNFTKSLNTTNTCNQPRHHSQPRNGRKQRLLCCICMCNVVFPHKVSIKPTKSSTFCSTILTMRYGSPTPVGFL